MPYEKSDNTTNVVRPTLTKILQKKKDTPQYRKYIKDKIEKEQLRRLSQDPYHAQISQERNYSAAEQKHREDKSKQMLEAEQLAKANQEAEVIIGGLTAPLLLNRIVGAAFHPDTHNLIDAIANLYTTDNHGFTEISDKTRQWAAENPEENAMINLVGDIIGPAALIRGTKMLPRVGFLQGGLRVGNYVYRAPRGQLNMGIIAPTPLRIPAIKEYTIDKAVKEQLSEQLSQKGKKFLGYASRDGGKTYNPMFEVSINGRTLKSFGKESLKANELKKIVDKYENFVKPPQEVTDLQKLGLDFDQASWFRTRPKAYKPTKEDVTTFYGHVPEYKQIVEDLMTNGQLYKNGKQWYGIVDGQTVQLKDPEAYIVSQSKAFKGNYVYHNDDYANALSMNYVPNFIRNSSKTDIKNYPTWTSNNPLLNATFEKERQGLTLRNLVADEKNAEFIYIDPKDAYTTIARKNQIVIPTGPVPYGKDMNNNLINGLWRLFGPELKVKALRGNNGNFADNAGLFSYLEPLNLDLLLESNV